MCENCDKAKREDIGYKVVYRCTKNEQISEVVDTYFNERETYVDCLEPYKR